MLAWVSAAISTVRTLRDGGGHAVTFPGVCDENDIAVEAGASALLRCPGVRVEVRVQPVDVFSLLTLQRQAAR